MWWWVEGDYDRGKQLPTNKNPFILTMIYSLSAVGEVQARREAPPGVGRFEGLQRGPGPEVHHGKRQSGQGPGHYGRHQVPRVQAGRRQLRFDQGAGGEGAGDRLRGPEVATVGSLRKAAGPQLFPVSRATIKYPPVSPIVDMSLCRLAKIRYRGMLISLFRRFLGDAESACGGVAVAQRVVLGGNSVVGKEGKGKGRCKTQSPQSGQQQREYGS
jgi:hypothetical protein